MIGASCRLCAISCKMHFVANLAFLLSFCQMRFCGNFVAIRRNDSRRTRKPDFERLDFCRATCRVCHYDVSRLALRSVAIAQIPLRKRIVRASHILMRRVSWLCAPFPTANLSAQMVAWLTSLANTRFWRVMRLSFCEAKWRNRLLFLFATEHVGEAAEVLLELDADALRIER